jgi:hypothetical protein
MENVDHVAGLVVLIDRVYSILDTSDPAIPTQWKNEEHVAGVVVHIDGM